MRLPQLLKTGAFCTCVALGYIHMQMQIITLAYRQEKQTNQIRKLLEENGDITYNILMLKSPGHLGHKLLSQDSDMRFLDPDDVIQTTSLPSKIPGEEMKTSWASFPGVNSLFSLLPIGARTRSKP